MCVDCISLHGLVRGENMELGSDSDTGGQVTLYSKLSISFNLLYISGFNSCELSGEICSGAS